MKHDHFAFLKDHACTKWRMVWKEAKPEAGRPMVYL